MEIDLYISDDFYYQENLLEELVSDGGYIDGLKIISSDDTLPEKYCVFEYYQGYFRAVYLNADYIKDEAVLTILNHYCDTSLFEDLSDWTNLPKGVKYYNYEE